jgi:hypothetical protein
MKRRISIETILLMLIACGHGFGGEWGEGADASHGHRPHRFRPQGGWHPYGGGLVHWWNPHCFPCQVAPDDYCRKPMPRTCWPAYPPYYTWGPPEIGHGRTDCFHDSVTPH